MNMRRRIIMLIDESRELPARVTADVLLDAMRVPTEAMVQSAMAPYLHDNTEQFNAIMRSTIIGYWTAMLDAALTEAEPK